MANMVNEPSNKINGSTQDFKAKPLGGSSFEKMSHDAGEKIGMVASNFADSASNYMKTGREYVKENPAKGVAMAVAAGAVAGGILAMILRRRQD